MKTTSFALLLSVALAGFGCKAARLAQDGSLKPKSEKALMKRLLDNQVSAEWLGARAKISYRDEHGGESFTANIRMRKDSLIWLNFKKFGLEGARALITPDSIFVIDRLNGQFVAKPFEHAQREYHLPVGFAGLQALLLGNPVFFSENSMASADSTRYLLSQKTDGYEAKYWLDGVKMLLREFAVEDLRQHRKMSVASSSYQLLDDKQNFAYFRTLHLSSPDLGELSVEVEFTKVEINVPQNIEFEIPERYERVD